MAEIDLKQISLHQSFVETIRIAIETTNYSGDCEDLASAISEDVLSVWRVSEREQGVA